MRFHHYNKSPLELAKDHTYRMELLFPGEGRLSESGATFERNFAERFIRSGEYSREVDQQSASDPISKSRFMTRDQRALSDTYSDKW